MCGIASFFFFFQWSPKPTAASNSLIVPSFPCWKNTTVLKSQVCSSKHNQNHPLNKAQVLFTSFPPHFITFYNNFRCNCAYLTYYAYNHVIYKICIIQIFCIFYIFCIFTDWLDDIGSKLVYERKENKQVLYVVPIASILGRLALVPAGDTGTIPHSMRSESASYPGASCDSRPGAGDGSRWWYVNTWALTWSSKP